MPLGIQGSSQKCVYLEIVKKALSHGKGHTSKQRVKSGYDKCHTANIEREFRAFH